MDPASVTDAHPHLQEWLSGSTSEHPLHSDVDEAVLAASSGCLHRSTMRRPSYPVLKWRRSRQVPEGYVSNGCHHCDTILGSWHLGEESLPATAPRAGPVST